MKNIIILVVIVVLIVMGFKFFNKDSSSNIPKNASQGFIQVNNSLNEYEKIIETYENNGGIKTPQDMMKFSSEIQTKFPTYSSSDMSPSEANIISDRLKKLQSRQMTLINNSR